MKCKNVFLGGSIVNHGGQNPIEPARFGLNILHGPNVQNFKDIYHLFYKLKIAHKFINTKQLINIIIYRGSIYKYINYLSNGNLTIRFTGTVEMALGPDAGKSAR